ncbi:MAG: hypothetical protein ABI307_10535, partial [Mycobacterium sp.]
PAAAGAGFFPPYIIGPPGNRFDSGVSARASARASARSKALQPDTAGAAAATAREQARARRRRRATQRGHGDEYMDMDVEVDPEWGAPIGERPTASTVAAGQGAGALGFAGAAVKPRVALAAGLAKLTGDGFGGGPRVPLLPDSWGDRESESPEPG